MALHKKLAHLTTCEHTQQHLQLHNAALIVRLLTGLRT